MDEGYRKTRMEMVTMVMVRGMDDCEDGMKFMLVKTHHHSRRSAEYLG